MVPGPKNHVSTKRRESWRAGPASLPAQRKRQACGRVVMRRASNSLLRLLLCFLRFCAFDGGLHRIIAGLCLASAAAFALPAWLSRRSFSLQALLSRLKRARELSERTFSLLLPSEPLPIDSTEQVEYGSDRRRRRCHTRCNPLNYDARAAPDPLPAHTSRAAAAVMRPDRLQHTSHSECRLAVAEVEESRFVSAQGRNW